MKCYQVKIFGKVQGVWYRGSTQQKAKELGLKGSVQNMPDGSVLLQVEGEEKLVQQLVDWCKIGPQHAAVERLELEEIKPKGFQSFEIIR